MKIILQRGQWKENSTWSNCLFNLVNLKEYYRLMEPRSVLKALEEIITLRKIDQD
jgi:hypothetical protein